MGAWSPGRFLLPLAWLALPLLASAQSLRHSELPAVFDRDPGLKRLLYQVLDRRLMESRGEHSLELLDSLAKSAGADASLPRARFEELRGNIAKRGAAYRLIQSLGNDAGYYRELRAWQRDVDAFLDQSPYSFLGEEAALAADLRLKAQNKRLTKEEKSGLIEKPSLAFYQKYPLLARYRKERTDHRRLQVKALREGLLEDYVNFTPAELGLDLPGVRLLRTGAYEGRKGLYAMPEAGQGKVTFESADGRMFMTRSLDPKTRQEIIALRFLREDGKLEKESFINGERRADILYQYDGRGRLAATTVNKSDFVPAPPRARK